MKINRIIVREILDFEKEIGRELIIDERMTTDNNYSYSARFKGGETIDGGVLCTYSGRGQTIDDAIRDYAKIISGQTMVFNAYSKGRREVEVPILIHTKKYNHGMERKYATDEDIKNFVKKGSSQMETLQVARKAVLQAQGLLQVRDK